MRLLVCGGRNYLNEEVLSKTLNYVKANYPIEVLMHGNASGADKMAHIWAIANGVRCEAYPAEWAKYGKRAGMVRNTHMLTVGKPSHVLAFPGGSGTANMVKQSRDAGLPVWEVQN